MSQPERVPPRVPPAERAPSPRPPAALVQDSDLLVDDRSFAAAYGESLESTLDLDTWESGADLSDLYQRLEGEVEEAVQTENELGQAIRREIFPRLACRPGAPAVAGCYRASPADLEQIHRRLLFNGAVEVCDGTSVEYDTLPITITQIGVVLVAYQGDQQTFAHRLFRRDLRVRSGNALEDALALLDNRSQRGSTDAEERSRLSALGRRGIMTHAERAVLTYRSTAPWRVGHGVPAPYELLTGSGSMELLERSLQTLHDLIVRHRKILFVPSAPTDRRLLTIGQGLYPLEYALIQTAEHSMLTVVEAGHYSRKYRSLAEQFCREIGPQLVVGVYRSSPAAPPYMFYCHIDHCHEAALIALADSVLQDHRGFPMLIDLADALCRTTFGNDIFNGAVQTAYATAGAPFRFQTERQTRS